MFLVTIAFIGFLLISNYRSQVNLREVALGQLRRDTEKHADAVSYFFDERKNDIQNLAQSRIVSSFFENKALGMSMEHGLRANLLGISEHLTHLVDAKKIGSDEIYARIFLIDSDGKLIVDNETFALRTRA